MFVKFKDGTTRDCANPTEQKIFKSGDAAGWMCALVITQDMASDEADAVITPENVSELTFCSDEGNTLFTLTGYEKITTTVIRHSAGSATVEIQMLKGV